MRTALEKMIYAINQEKANPKVYWIDWFFFEYGACRIEMAGHYYAFVIGDNIKGEIEYNWNSFEEMLDDKILETGKTVREMLSELEEHELAIFY